MDVDDHTFSHQRSAVATSGIRRAEGQRRAEIDCGANLRQHFIDPPHLFDGVCAPHHYHHLSEREEMVLNGGFITVLGGQKMMAN